MIAFAGVIPLLIAVLASTTLASADAHHYGDFLYNHPIVGIAVLCLLALFTLFGLFEVARLSILLAAR